MKGLRLLSLYISRLSDLTAVCLYISAANLFQEAVLGQPGATEGLAVAWKACTALWPRRRVRWFSGRSSNSLLTSFRIRPGSRSYQYCLYQEALHIKGKCFSSPIIHFQFSDADAGRDAMVSVSWIAALIT
jgi:hypothetical protein